MDGDGVADVGPLSLEDGPDGAVAEANEHADARPYPDDDPPSFAGSVGSTLPGSPNGGGGSAATTPIA